MSKAPTSQLQNVEYLWCNITAPIIAFTVFLKKGFENVYWHAITLMSLLQYQLDQCYRNSVSEEPSYGLQHYF